jgi:hypothetical protein
MAEGTLIFDTEIDKNGLFSSASDVAKQFSAIKSSSAAVAKNVTTTAAGTKSMSSALASSALKIAAISAGMGSLLKVVGAVVRRANETSGAFRLFRAEISKVVDALVLVADPLIRLIMPAVDWLVSRLSAMARVVGSILSSVANFFGIASSKKMGAIADAATDVSTGMGNIGKAAKKARLELTSFDTIIRLGTKDTSKFGGGGGGGVGKNIGKTLKDLAPIGKISRGLKDLTAVLLGLAAAGKKGAGIAAMITGIGHAIQDSKDIIGKGFNTKNLTSWLADMAEIIGGGALAGGKLGAGVAALFAGLGTLIMSEYDKFKRGENWKNVLAGIAGQVAAIGGAWAVGGKKGAGIAALFTGMAGFLLDEWDKFKSGGTIAGLVSQIENEAVSIGGAWALGGKRLAGITALFEGMFGFLVSEWNRFKNGNQWRTVLDGISQSALAIGGAWAVGGAKTAGITALFTGMIGAFDTAFIEFKKGINVAGVVSWIEKSAELILGAGLTGGKTGGALASIFVGALGSYTALHDALAKGFDVSNMTQAVTSLAMTFGALALKIGGAGAAAGTSAVGALALLVTDIEKMVKTGPSVQGWFQILTGGLNIATAAFVAFNTTNPIGWLTLLGATIANVVTHWEGLGNVVQRVAQWLKDAWSGIAAWFSSSVVDPLVKTWEGITNKITTPVQTAYNNIVRIFNGLENFFSNIINGVRRIWDNFMSIFRRDRSEVNSGSSSSRYSAPLPTLNVPHLARGAVIPPNNPYLAVVGDQKSGTNVEAPLETIVAALKEALASIVPQQNSSQQEAVLEIDGDVFGKLVYKLNSNENNRVGVSIVETEG